MNPDVKPGDTIRVVRVEGIHRPLHEMYDGQPAVVLEEPDADGDVLVEFEKAYVGCNQWVVSEWELAIPTDQPDPLTHLTDHVGSPATLTVAGRTYTATLAHVAAPVGAMEWPSVELTDIKGQA